MSKPKKLNLQKLSGNKDKHQLANITTTTNDDYKGYILRFDYYNHQQCNMHKLVKSSKAMYNILIEKFKEINQFDKTNQREINRLFPSNYGGPKIKNPINSSYKAILHSIPNLSNDISLWHCNLGSRDVARLFFVVESNYIFILGVTEVGFGK